MRTAILICCYLLFHFSSLSQVIIVEDSTGQPIPFATLEVAKKNASWFCNAKGKIDIGMLSIEPADTLIISSIGYKTMRIARNKVASLVVLSPYVRQMPEAFIYQGDWKSDIYGMKRKRSQQSAYTSYMLKGPGEQVGRIIFPGKEMEGPVFLERISFLFSKAGKTRAPARLRIYEVNDNLMPGADVLVKNLVSKMESEDGWLDFDLAELGIRLDKKGLIVAVEFFDTDSVYWHKEPNWMTVDSSGKPVYYTANVLGGLFRTDDYLDDCYSYIRKNGEWTKMDSRLLVRPYHCFNLVTRISVKYPDKKRK